MAEQEAEEGEFSFADIARLPETDERPTVSKTFEAKGRKWKITIYADGRDDAERWTKLVGAQNFGHNEQTIAKLNKEVYQIAIGLPSGREMIVTDPDYIGSAKVFSECLKSPKMSFDECLVFGRKIGRAFREMMDWAAQQNGLSEFFLEQYLEIEKNANSPETAE